MAGLDTEKDFLDLFSVENLIRTATQPPEVLKLPAEYAQQRPDILGMQTDDLLGRMSNTIAPTPGGPGSVPYTDTTYGDRSNAALKPFTPMNVSYNKALPVVGRDIGLSDIEKIIKARESTNNYTALNRERKGNTASGAYQYTDATWNGYGGYAKAMYAPPAVQDKRFREDIQARFQKFKGDPFKMIAAHYLPAAASNPSTWTQPYKLPSGKVVKPVASYIAYVVKGTPLESAFHAYLRQQQ